MDGTDTPEASPEAAAILADAGWKPHDEWHVFTRGTLVMGFDPLGTGFHVKNTARSPDGPDTPDDPIAAARWLVARFPANPLSTEATLKTPAVEAVNEVFHVETEAEHPLHLADDQPIAEPTSEPAEFPVHGGEILDETEAQGDVEPIADTMITDGEFSEFGDLPPDDGLGLGELDDYRRDPLLLEGDEPEASATEEGGGPTFIGLDDLDHRRAIACHLVRMHAKSLMPFWTTNEQTALTELRNYALGVQINGWPDDPDRRAELDGLEATAARINQIEVARDAKVEFLESASREEIEAFNHEADWP